MILLLITLLYDFLSKLGGRAGGGVAREKRNAFLRQRLGGKNAKQCFGIP